MLSTYKRGAHYGVDLSWVSDVAGAAEYIGGGVIGSRASKSMQKAQLEHEQEMAKLASQAEQSRMESEGRLESIKAKFAMANIAKNTPLLVGILAATGITITVLITKPWQK
jgi:hypothetical protein|tara:strand:+ start:3091 stop:3423 length:333 start_codon:yes stop_codon:yes gene_type:complete